MHTSKRRATRRRKGAPAQMVENAYSAAIDMLNDLGSYTRIHAVFSSMRELQLPEKRRERYARLGERYAAVQDHPARIVPFPNHLKMDAANHVWRLDVLEWEHAGDAGETMGEVAFDTAWPDFTRARALMRRLFAQSSLDVDPDGRTTRIARRSISDARRSMWRWRRLRRSISTRTQQCVLRWLARYGSFTSSVRSPRLLR